MKIIIFSSPCSSKLTKLSVFCRKKADAFSFYFHLHLFHLMSTLKNLPSSYKNDQRHHESILTLVYMMHPLYSCLQKSWYPEAHQCRTSWSSSSSQSLLLIFSGLSIVVIDEVKNNKLVHTLVSLAADLWPNTVLLNITGVKVNLTRVNYSYDDHVEHSHHYFSWLQCADKYFPVKRFAL